MAALNTLCISSTFSLSIAPPSRISVASPIRFPNNFSGQSIRVAVSAKKSAASAAPAATAPAKKELKGIMKPMPISPELQAVVGVPEIARTEALKVIWIYIKKHELQDSQNKKIILCDEKLKTIFGKDQVGFLEISKLLNPHFIK